jgi:hypothetical protein
VPKRRTSIGHASEFATRPARTHRLVPRCPKTAFTSVNVPSAFLARLIMQIVPDLSACSITRRQILFPLLQFENDVFQKLGVHRIGPKQYQHSNSIRRIVKSWTFCCILKLLDLPFTQSAHPMSHSSILGFDCRAAPTLSHGKIGASSRVIFLKTTFLRQIPGGIDRIRAR